MAVNPRNRAIFLLGIAGILVCVGLVYGLRGRQKAVLIAEKLIGQTEITGNVGFTSPGFERLMEKVGWKSGDAWCVYFVKLVWYNSVPSWLKPKILAKVSGNTDQTWTNLSNDTNFTTPDVPAPGDIVIWKQYSNGIPQWEGHAGIVKSLGFGKIKTIEGNTNNNGSSNGYIVAERERPLDFTNNNGLRIVGFIRIA